MLIIIFIFILLVIYILTIWDVYNNELMKELLIKTSYTFGIITIVSIVVAYLSNIKK